MKYDFVFKLVFKISVYQIDFNIYDITSNFNIFQYSVDISPTTTTVVWATIISHQPVSLLPLLSPLLSIPYRVATIILNIYINKICQIMSLKLPTDPLSLSFFCFCFFVLFCFVFWLRRAACGTLVPWPGVEPGPMAVKAPSPNHWTTREFPQILFWLLISHRIKSRVPQACKAHDLLTLVSLTSVPAIFHWIHSAWAAPLRTLLFTLYWLLFLSVFT